MKKAKKGILLIIVSLLVAVLAFTAAGCTKGKGKNKGKNPAEDVDVNKAQEKRQQENFAKFSKFLDEMDSSVSKAGQHKVDKNGVIEVGADVELKIGNSSKIGEVENGVETIIKTKAIIDRKNGYQNSAFFASIYNKTADRNICTFSYYLNDMNTIYLEVAGQKVAFKFDAGKYTQAGNADSYASLFKKILDENEWLKGKIASKLGVNLNDKSTASNLINAVLSSPISKHFENLADAFGSDFSVKKALNAFIKDLKVPNKKGEAKKIVESIEENIGAFKELAKIVGVDVDKIIKNGEIDLLEAIKNINVTKFLGIETDGKKTTVTNLKLLEKVLNGVNFDGKDRIQFEYETQGDKFSAIQFAAMLNNIKLKGKGLGLTARLSNITVRNYSQEATKENLANTFGVNLSEYKEDYKIESEQTYTISGLKADLNKFSKVFPEGTIFDSVSDSEEITVKAVGTLDLFNAVEKNGVSNKTAFKMEIKNKKGEMLAKVVFNERTLNIEVTNNKVGGVEASKIMHYAAIHAIKHLLAVRTKNATFNTNVQNLAKNIATEIFETVYTTKAEADADPDAIVFNRYTLTAENKAKKEFFFGVKPKVKSSAPTVFNFDNIDVLKLFNTRFIPQEDSYKIAKKTETDHNYINLFEKLAKPTVGKIVGLLNLIKDFDKDKLEIEKKMESSLFGLLSGVVQENKDKAIAYSLVNLKGYVDDYYKIGVFKNTYEEIKEALKNPEIEANRKIISDARTSAELAYGVQCGDYAYYQKSVEPAKQKSKEEVDKVRNKYGVSWLANVLKGTKGLDEGIKTLINKTDQAAFKAIWTALENGIEEEYKFEMKDSVKFTAKRTTKVIAGQTTNLSSEVLNHGGATFDLANLTA